ncbi:MAG: helicase-exonuclease AddAB subunit AddA [Lachnospiraceae bacterium]|nr:helicase-exonuclease AddAB subunit AddA [Lachnospiraceae bacterium]
MAFTEEQLQAIKIRNKNLLLSAAAGSGKTTVLVERIIRRVTEDKEPVDIDRLLVMTFTKAAAEQMKEKILKAIEDKRAANPMDEYLIKQAALVHNAKISTIHGFCLDVIRNHFQEIDMDPDFRVADEAECKLLKQDILSKCLEEEYEKGSEDFIDFTECFATGKNDNSILEVLDRMYEYAMSAPEPERWLDKCLAVYSEPEKNKEWMRVLTDLAGINIEYIYNLASMAYELCADTDGPYMYTEAVKNDMELLENLREKKSYEEYRYHIRSVEFMRLGRPKKGGPYVDPEIAERVKSIRNEYKKVIEGLKNKEFLISSEENDRRIRDCLPVAEEIVRLTRIIMEKYSGEKRKRKIVDFADLEHLCLKILRLNNESTAKEYRNYFREIYVDEYQDSNLIQEEIIKYISRGNNIFMVGDVKQSIYSFRLARPQLFMDKYNSFKTYSKNTELPDTDVNIKIDLHHNFRSRESVLVSVNELFKQIMTREIGGIEYNEDVALYPKACYPMVEESKEKTELILISSEEGMDERELEAGIIAERINELMSGHKVYDPTEDEPDRMRPVKYSDIVILLRSLKGWDETFKKVILSAGIPVHSMTQSGYFEADEISVLLDYLRVLDNPLQDIPLTAVLKAGFLRFSDEELAILHLKYPDKYLFGSLVLCSKDDVPGELGEKSQKFLSGYKKLRDKTGYISVYELLLEIIDGEYGLYVSCMPDGKRRKANLNMLLKKAEDYGKTSYKGLFHFVRYIEMLKKYEIDYGEANLADENDDAVRIMSIHKSKGLEFPVCFIAGMSKGYNSRDLYNSLITDIDLGMAFNFVDPLRRIKQTTLLKTAIADKKNLEMMAEEERILYVAMTRAREKLIMTGVVKDINKTLASQKALINCNSFLQLLIFGMNNDGLKSIKVNTLSASALINSRIITHIDIEARRQKMMDMWAEPGGKGPGSETGNEIVENDIETILLERCCFEYPYENERKIFEKVSVSELKKRSMQEDTPEVLREDSRFFELPGEEISPPVPDFMKAELRELPANIHGTAVHRVFELWNYDNGTSEEDIGSFLKYIRNEGLMEDELVNSVKISEISDFVNSALAVRMKKAFKEGRLYREQPFMFSIEGLLIQGIIDAYFIEDDKLVIVDYKTDAVEKTEELVNRYHVQLEYYAKALLNMTGKEIGELIIYSTKHKCTVNIPWPVLNLI